MGFIIHKIHYYSLRFIKFWRVEIWISSICISNFILDELLNQINSVNEIAKEKYILTFKNIESRNRIVTENLKCTKYYEKLFIVSTTTSDANEVWSKIPNEYNIRWNQDLNQGARGIIHKKILCL